MVSKSTLILLWFLGAIITRAICSNDEFVDDVFKKVHNEILDTIKNVQKRSAQSASITPKLIYEGVLTTYNNSLPIFPIKVKDKTFVLIGNNILEVSVKTNLTKQVATLELGNQIYGQDVAFVKVAEWEDILFLLVGYKKGYCRLFTSSQDMMSFVLQQTIHNVGQPRDAEFFKFRGVLYLVLVMHKSHHLLLHSYIYRWTGTHLDETETFMTRGAVAVRTFSTPNAVMIVVAQNLPDDPMIGSQVLRMQEKRLERVQFLATNAPLMLQPFTTKGQQYLLIINEQAPASTYLWTGNELLPWESIPRLHGKYEIAVSNSNAYQQMIYLLQNHSVLVYEPDELQFRALMKYTVPTERVTEVVTITVLAIKQDLLLLISKTTEKLLINILKTSFFKSPAGAKQVKSKDPLLACLMKMEDKLGARKDHMKNIKYLSDNLLQTNEAVIIPGKLDIFGNLKVQNLTISAAFVANSAAEHHLSSSSSSILNAVEEINSELIKIENDMNNIIYNSKSGILKQNIIVEGDLLIQNAISKDFNATNVNGQPFEPQHLLSYSGNETLKELWVDTLIVHNLHAKNVGGKRVDDLLMTKGDHVFTGNVEVSDMLTRTVEAGNNIILYDGYNTNEQNIGLENIKHIKTTNLTVHTVNGALASDRIKHENERNGSMVINGNLTIKHLKVTHINGIHWDEFTSNLFLTSRNQTIEGHLSVDTKISLNNLTAIMINDVLTENWMTKSTDQTIEATIKVNHLTTAELLCQNVNGIDLRSDVVKITEESTISGGVMMHDVNVLGVLTVNDGAEFEGVVTHANNTTQIYKGKVTVDGNLKVDEIEFTERSVAYIRDNIFKFPESLKQFWTKSTNQVIPVNVQLVNPVKVTSDVVAEYINGHSARNYIHFDTKELYSNLTFSRVRVEGNVLQTDNATGFTVSGVDLKRLEKEAVRRRGHFVVHGSKQFSSGVSTNKLQCRILNDIETSNVVKVGSKDIMINGTKHFASLIVGGDLWSDGPINVNVVNNEIFSEKISSMVLVNQPYSVASAEFENLKAPELQTVLLNGENMEILNDANADAWTNSSVILEIHGNVVFKDNLYVNKINKIPFDSFIDKVVSKSNGGVINGSLTIIGNVDLENLQSDKFNDVNVSHLLSKALSKSKEQVITGYFTIDNVNTEHLDTDIINGVNMNKLIFINEINQDQKFLGQIIFNNVTFEHLNVDTINTCNLAKAFQSISNIKGDRHFNEVKIEGSLEWEYDAQLLSDIFKNAVTRNEDQTISGKVTFLGHVATSSVQTQNHINGVNLEAIAQDALYKSGYEPQLITGSKFFEGKVTIETGTVSGDANLKIVNGIDVLAFNSSLVHTNNEDGRLIRGHKNFIAGFAADEFTCKGVINNIYPGDIATFDNTMNISAYFQNLEIANDLNVLNINDVGINTFLSQRVTLKAPQKIEGFIMFKNHLKINGQISIGKLNDVDMDNVVYTTSNEAGRFIKGCKTFTQSVEVRGNLDALFINKWNVSNVFGTSLLVDEDAEIYGDLVFAGDVAINNNIDVVGVVNEISLKYLPHLVEQEAISNLQNIKTYSKDIALTIESARNKTRGMASEFMYFENIGPIALSDVRRASAVSVGPSTAMIITETWGSPQECDLPEGCPCIQQNLIIFLQNGSIFTNKVQNSERHFYIIDNTKKSNLAVKVTTNTVSLSNRCQVKSTFNELAQQGTSIRWTIPNSKDAAFFNDLAVAQVVETTENSFLSDVKGFKLGSATFIVLALFYSPKKDTHDIDSLVLRMTPREHKPKIVQKLPTNGARMLELVYKEVEKKRSSPLLHLIVGNTFSSALNQSSVDLHIYSFDAKREKFDLMRAYPTTGALAVKSLVIGGDILVLVAQQAGAPLVILKYNLSQQNYFFFQEIIFEAPVLDIGVFYVGGYDAYFGAATGNGMLHVYKYAYVEGFKLVKVHVRGYVQGFTPFSVGDDNLLFLSSRSNSHILRIVTQGP